MRIADVLRNKGAAVMTINPEATVQELLAGLAEQNIGAMVVVGAEGVVGIVSERDVVRAAAHAWCQRAVPPGLQDHDQPRSRPARRPTRSTRSAC